MAAVVDYRITDVESGVYGLYNHFLIDISRSGGLAYNISYRIQGVYIDEGNQTVTKDVTPNEIFEITLNPLELLKYFFKVNGDKSANRVAVSVGEVSSDLPDEPPIFRGYDDSKEFQVYNGYEYTEEINFKEPGWDTNNFSPSFPVKLLAAKKSVSILDNEELYVSALNMFGDLSSVGYQLLNAVIYWFDSAGALISTDTQPIPSLSTFYANHVPVGTDADSLFTYPSNWNSAIGTLEYDDIFNPENVITEPFAINKGTCSRFDRYRLRWYNRYGGYEYETFQMKSKYAMIWDQGKEILTDGIDQPQILEYGKSGRTEYELNTSWLDENQQLALRELYESPRVSMIMPNGDVVPVLVSDRNYEVTDIRDGLFKLTVRVRLAKYNKARVQ